MERHAMSTIDIEHWRERAETAERERAAARMTAEIAAAAVEKLQADVEQARDAVQEACDVAVTAACEAIERERDEALAEVARLREALSQLLGEGHNLKAFAGTMLRWNEPGVDFSDEARRIMEHATSWHRTICAALADDPRDPAFYRAGQTGTEPAEPQKTDAQLDAQSQFTGGVRESSTDAGVRPLDACAVCGGDLSRPEPLCPGCLRGAGKAGAT
jgi:hypothetical protein